MINLFNVQTKNINQAAFILGLTSLISAILGLIRDRLLAGTFGAGEELDIYYTAFRLPDLISTTLIIGAIGAAIIPIFCEKLVKNRQNAFIYLSNFLNLFSIIIIIISGILFIFTPSIISLIAPGFLAEKQELTVLLSRIMFLSPIFLGFSNVISGILRIFKRFFITSLAPIMYNLGIIIGILFFYPQVGLSGLAWGVVFGGFLHLLIQIPILIKIGFKLEKVFNFFEPDFIRTIKLMIPRSIGLAAGQINLIIITAIASNFAGGSVSALGFAESLSRPLLTFIGVSFSTVAFPSLSLAFSKENLGKFQKIFFLTFNKILIFTIPLSLILFLFRDSLVRIILNVGKFDLTDGQLIAACLGMFLFGTFAQALLLLLAKAFYALQDTKTPALISILGVAVNIFFSLFLIRFLSYPNFLINFLNLTDARIIEVISLPLALSLSSILQFILLLFLFHRKIKRLLVNNQFKK